MTAALAWAVAVLDAVIAFEMKHGYKLEHLAKTSYWCVGVFGWLCVAVASLAIVYAVVCWRMGW